MLLKYFFSFIIMYIYIYVCIYISISISISASIYLSISLSIYIYYTYQEGRLLHKMGKSIYSCQEVHLTIILMSCIYYSIDETYTQKEKNLHYPSLFFLLPLQRNRHPLLPLKDSSIRPLLLQTYTLSTKLSSSHIKQ